MQSNKLQPFINHETILKLLQQWWKRRGLMVTISDYGAGGPRFKSRRRRFNLFSEFKLFGRYHHIELAQREASAKATTQTDGGKSSL